MGVRFRVLRGWNFEAISSSVPSDPPGKLTAAQRYNDDYFGWPVAPVQRQHPIRSTLLDPRADDRHGAIYHQGVDIAVNDVQPERGAPRARTHRVYAIEGGVVEEATPPGVRGNVHLGHFGYGHVDASVRPGQRVFAGQMIGWTWLTTWHVHLSEFLFLPGGRRILVNPLRSGGKLRPYVDRLGPLIHEVRFYTPADAHWGRRRTNVAVLRAAGRRLDRQRLSGSVDIRVRAADRALPEVRDEVLDLPAATPLRPHSLSGRSDIRPQVIFSHWHPPFAGQLAFGRSRCSHRLGRRAS